MTRKLNYYERETLRLLRGCEQATEKVTTFIAEYGASLSDAERETLAKTLHEVLPKLARAEALVKEELRRREAAGEPDLPQEQ
jgi:hypothetical protein